MSLEDSRASLVNFLQDLNTSNISIARLHVIVEHLTKINVEDEETTNCGLRKLLSLQVVLQNSLDDNFICLYIKCLSIFLDKFSSRLTEVNSDLLGDGSLLDHFLKSIFDKVKSESLSCVKILLSRYATPKDVDKEPILRWIFTVCLRFASWSNHKPKTEIISLKIINTAWECIELITENHGKIMSRFLPSIVDILKKALSFGLPGSTLASKLQYSSSSDLNSGAGTAIKKRNASVVSMSDRNFDTWKPCTSSDESFSCSSDQIGLSEFSDSKSEVDYEKIEHKTKTLQSRIRLCAASVFMRIPKIIDANQLSKYWLTFFPDYCGRSWFTVCKILTQGTCFNLRILLLKGMRNWVECNSRLLASAEIPRKDMPFTSLSEKLAQSLLDIHDSLELIVKLERYPSVIAQCLKCFESLARVTPYEKVDNVRFFNIFSQCHRYVTDKNLNVKINALRLYAVLISNNLSKNVENSDQNTFIFSLTEIGILGADNRSIFPNDMCANPNNLRLACLLLLVEIVKHFRLYIENQMKTLASLARDSIMVKKNSTSMAPNDRGIILAGLQLLKAIIDNDSEISWVTHIVRLEDLQIFILPQTASQDASLTSFTVELIGKMIESDMLAHDTHSLEKIVDDLIHLSIHSHSNSQILTPVLKYLPPIVKQCQNLELKTWQRMFEMMLGVLKTSSANIAEKAGCSFIYLTRIFMIIFTNLSNSDQVLQFHQMIHTIVIQTTSLVVDGSYVQRIKPSCLFSICLYLDVLLILKPELYNRKDNYLSDKEKIFRIVDSILPVVTVYCRSEIIRVQKNALDCASMIFSIFPCLEDIEQLQLQSALNNLLTVICETIQMPCKKPRNVMLGARALRSIRKNLWKDFFQDHLPTALFALLAFLEHFDDVTIDLEPAVSQLIFFETIRCVIYLVPFCDESPVKHILPMIDSILINKNLALYQDLLKQEAECVKLDEKLIIMLEYDKFSDAITKLVPFPNSILLKLIK